VAARLAGQSAHREVRLTESHRLSVWRGFRPSGSSSWIQAGWCLYKVAASKRGPAEPRWMRRRQQGLSAGSLRAVRQSGRQLPGRAVDGKRRSSGTTPDARQFT